MVALATALFGSHLKELNCPLPSAPYFIGQVQNTVKACILGLTFLSDLSKRSLKPPLTPLSAPLVPEASAFVFDQVAGMRNFFFYHGFADLLRHIRILSILRAHFGLIRCIHRQINARGRLAYRLVITGIYA